MKRSEHIKFAEFVAMQTYYEEMKRLGKQRDPLTDFMAQNAAEWIGRNIGTLPDWLEPGYNQYHRKLFHSIDIGKSMEWIKKELRSKPSKTWWLDISLIMALSAYQSHFHWRPFGRWGNTE